MCAIINSDYFWEKGFVGLEGEIERFISYYREYIIFII